MFEALENRTMLAVINFLLSADDYAKLTIDGSSVALVDTYSGGSASASVDLSPGSHDIDLQFQNRWGSSWLSLGWKTPDETSYTPIPKANLISDDALGNPISGLRADYNSTGTGSFTIYGEGPISHNHRNVYEGVSGRPWGGFVSTWTLFTETLSGQLLVDGASPDIIAQSLTWDATNAGVEFEYSVEDADLPEETTAALYWSSDDTFDSNDTVASQSFTIDTQQTTQPVSHSVPVTDLADSPIGTTHLLLVVDPANEIAESNEENNTVAVELHTATIDVKPGSDRNPINLNSKGMIPISIFTTNDFDASWVDISTVQFAGASPAHFAYEDVDGDGDMDLILHFRLQDTNLLGMYEDLLREDLEDGKLDDNHKVVDAVLTGIASKDGEDEFDFFGTDSIDMFLNGKMLKELLGTL
jgi:hypothetical protein